MRLVDSIYAIFRNVDSIEWLTTTVSAKAFAADIYQTQILAVFDTASISCLQKLTRSGQEMIHKSSGRYQLITVLR